MTYRSKYLRAICTALLLAVCSGLSTSAHAWWKPEWTQRTRVDLDTSATGVPTQAAVNGFLLALRLHSGNFDFASAQENGADLRVISGDDKTPLKFHIERYDAVNELAVIWVQLPSLPPGQAKTRLFVYAGNAKAAAEPAASAADAGDASTLAVFHLDKPEAADLRGTLRATAPITPLGQALLGGGALSAQQGITWPANDRLKVAAGGVLTWSLWVKPDGASGALLQQGPLSLALRGGKLEARAGGKAVVGGDVPPAAWTHVALVLAQGQATLYVNGTASTPAPLAVPAVAGELSAGKGYAGALDEIQIAGAARSADHIQLSVDSQGAGTKLVKTVKQDPKSAEAGEGDGEAHAGYMGILIANLTIDAWVVIIILLVMFVIACWVMIGKAVSIARTTKANSRFLEQFKSSGANLLAVPESPEVQRSSLYRVYQSGLRELLQRNVSNATQPLPGEGLSGASISAVRAAVDADLVRETHKLNSGIVLLTIAISGGPFLGLLGTVVGVMITFAAIAAAGDVNVNAIAPGIAAALLATVAGLAVAIPALFGYNYLAGKIKNLTSDMHIFADEFIARVAERYGAS